MNYTEYKENQLKDIVRRFIFERDLEGEFYSNNLKLVIVEEHTTLAHYYGDRSGNIFIRIVFVPFFEHDGTPAKSMLDNVDLFYLDGGKDKLTKKLLELFYD